MQTQQTEPHPMQPYDEAWRREHLKSIGGSTAPAVLGVSRFRTPAQVWDQLHAVLVENRVPPPLRESDDLRRGKVFEHVAIDLMAERLGVSIHPHDQTRFIQRDDAPWAHALPDAWIGDDPVEVKVPRPGTVSKANMKGLLKEWVVQAVHNVAICDARGCHFGYLDPISAVLYYEYVPRDPKMENDILEQEQAFWASVQAGHRPEETDTRQDIEDDDSKVIIEGTEVVAAAESFFRLREIVSDAQEALEAAKEKLIGLSGDVPAFEIPRLGRFYHKPTKPRRLFDRARAEQDFPALKDEKYWKIGKPSRPFRAYDLRT